VISTAECAEACVVACSPAATSVAGRGTDSAVLQQGNGIGDVTVRHCEDNAAGWYVIMSQLCLQTGCTISCMQISSAAAGRTWGYAWSHLRAGVNLGVACAVLSHSC
jgi:hypothetical protein